MQHKNVQWHLGIADLLLAMHSPRVMHIDEDFEANTQTVTRYQFTVSGFHMQPRLANLLSILLFAAKFKSNRQMTIVGNSEITRVRLIELNDIEIDIRLLHRDL